MDRSQARSLWRQNWATDLLAVVFLVVVLIFGAVLAQRASDARHLARALDQKTERQRQAICAILANIPGHVPPEIENARRVFGRPRHPQDCQPMPHLRPTPRPTRERPAAGPTYIVVRPSREPSPGPTHYPKPTPRPTHSPSPTPRPTHSPHPSPSPSCILPPPLRCPPI